MHAKIELPKAFSVRDEHEFPLKGRIPMTDPDAFQEGYDAYWGQGGSDDNPYPQETEKHDSWTAGWLKADQEDYEEDVSGES